MLRDHTALPTHRTYSRGGLTTSLRIYFETAFSSARAWSIWS